MGRVFTPEQIEAGAVPEPANFEIAGRELLGMLATGMLEPGNEASTFNSGSYILDGAFIFGSATKGESNVRSDLDVFVSYSIGSSTMSQAILGLRPAFAELQTRWHIAVEPVILHTAQLMDGDHSVDPIFEQNLRSVPAEWHVGNNPLDHIQDQSKSWSAVVHDYAMHKERKFTKALADTDTTVDYKVMQRALELPSALGRKCLALVYSRQALENNDYRDASKQKVVQAIAEIAPAAIVAPLNKLVEFDRSYNHVLTNVINGRIRPDKYLSLLKAMYLPVVATALELTVSLEEFAQIF